MTINPQSLIRLLSWLSPAFPTGAFSYSHGLEAAIGDCLITNRDSLQDWLEALVSQGPGWNDCVLLAESWRLSVAGKNLEDVTELGLALAGSKERYLETTAQGAAFLKAVAEWGNFKHLPENCPLPVAIGSICAAHNVALEETVSAFQHAYVSNQIQAALRLMKLGQQNGVKILKALEPLILETAVRAQNSTLDDLGSAAVVAEISAMRHETMAARIFRS